MHTWPRLGDMVSKEELVHLPGGSMANMNVVTPPPNAFRDTSAVTVDLFISFTLETLELLCKIDHLTMC